MGLREAYIEKVTSQLAEWQAWIEEYQAAGHAATSHWWVDPGRMMQRLEERFQRACGSLSALHTAPEPSWMRAKNDMERALLELKIALDESGAGRIGRDLTMHSSRAHVYSPFSRKA